MKKILMTAVFVLAVASTGWANPQGCSGQQCQREFGRYQGKQHQLSKWNKIQKRNQKAYRKHKVCNLCRRKAPGLRKKCAHWKNTRREHLGRFPQGGYVQVGRYGENGYFRVVFGNKF